MERVPLSYVHPGDIVEADLRDKRVYEGACVKVTSEKLIILHVPRHEVSPIVIAGRDIARIMRAIPAAKAVPIHTNGALKPGGLISTTVERRRFYGKVIAAWKGFVIARTKDGRDLHVHLDELHVE